MKYKNELVHLSDCPPKDDKYLYDIAYRFVFSPITQDSFIPQGIKSPSRISNANNNEGKCSLLALSMFISEESAVQRFNQLMKNHKNIKKSLGTHLAKGFILATDGLQYKANSMGHFDFHECSNANLVSQFSIVKEL